MKLWKLINPSDEYTFEAPDLETAAAAVLLLSAGFGAEEVNGEGEVPILAFSSDSQVNAWFQSSFGLDLEPWVARVMDVRRADVAAALESMLIGPASARKSFKLGLELIADEAKREQWRRHWLDERRSSMNNIGGKAWSIARDLRSTKAAKKPS